MELSNSELTALVLIDVFFDMSYVLLPVAAIAVCAVWYWWTDLVRLVRGNSKASALGDELTRDLPEGTRSIFDEDR